MSRDIRDPQAIGAALEAQRARNANEPISSIADRVLKESWLPPYSERKRPMDASSNGHGQLSMFRAA